MNMIYCNCRLINKDESDHRSSEHYINSSGKKGISTFERHLLFLTLVLVLGSGAPLIIFIFLLVLGFNDLTVS